VTPSTALIVEDQPDALAWLQATAAASFPGIGIATARSLADARRALAERQPHLALVDLGLPDGTGIDLVRAISAAQRDTVTVVTTVFGDDQHLFAALRARAQGYVLKDESRDQLGAMLRDIVSGQPPLSPAIARRLLAHFHDVARACPRPSSP
jgi:DNA-binding NarL/FixJ family response regulator